MEKFAITDVKGRWVLDSRGNPTVEAEVFVGGISGKAVVPSGASKGKREAVELRDNKKAFHGKGVDKAVKNIRKIIAPAIKGMDVRNQIDIDKKMIEIDGTENKSTLGANAILAVSLACARAASTCLKKSLYEYLGNENTLPVPFMNVINGGKHAGNELAIQEHMIAPLGASSFGDAVRMCSEVYHTMKGLIKRKYGKNGINVGDEGGFAPPLKSSEEAFELILDAVEENGYGGKIKLAIDAAATSFYENGFYSMQKKFSREELLDFYEEMVGKYPIVSIEDPFAEDDWEGFIEMTGKLGNRVQIVGDDIFVTNRRLLEKGIEEKACNALLLKPNQIGTLTECMEVARHCFKNSYAVMVSHRSGDTCDSFISDLAVALGTGQMKAGAPCRAERTEKYNRLMRIEDKLGNEAIYGKKLESI
ncbi:MAG: phosphopyruvate hydratase [Candidatus Thermoplasmatota archaeon]|nr:phosphopyruvate hydratase [Candidatus Thermoplasmatota archaeon]